MAGDAIEQVRQTSINWTVWACALALLAIPAIGMVVTREVAWGPGDFVLAAVLLGSACGAYELAVRAFTSRRARLIAVAVIVAALLTVWAELAVGLF